MMHANDNYPRYFERRRDYSSDQDLLAVLSDARHTVSEFSEWLAEQADDDRAFTKTALLFTPDIVDIGEFDELSAASEHLGPHEVCVLVLHECTTLAEIAELIHWDEQTASAAMEVVLALRALRDFGPVDGRKALPWPAVKGFLDASGLVGERA